MNKFCQSCGMPLEESTHGTESSGALSEKYCHLCYENGQFIEPDITYDQMLARGKKGIAEGSGSGISKFFLSTFYPFQLKKLDRWKK